MKVDLAIAMDGPLGADQRARELVAAGADGLFTFENAHDVFFPLLLAAGAVRCDLMTNVAMAFPRSPLHLAYAANDLQLLTEGRFRLGLGTQIRPHIERRYGARWGKPVGRMREWVLALKMMFAHFAGEGPFDFRGEHTQHTLMTPVFDPGPNPYGPPPVLVGALGPRMCAMAAEVADGVLVMPFNSARHLRERTVPALQEGLRRAGRDGTDFEVVAEVIVATGRDDAELAAAADGVRALLGFYGSTPAYRPVLDVEGWGDRQPRLRDLSRQGDWAGMAGLVDDDMVATLAVRGTPREAAAEIVERFAPYASRVCCYFPYAIADDTVAELVGAIGEAAAGRDDVGGVRA